MAATKPADPLSSLPQEILLLILDHLKWREIWPLRKLNQQWREFMDHYFVRAKSSNLRVGSDGQLKVQTLSRWTRKASLEPKHVLRLENWSILAAQCPRISTFSVGLENVQLRPSQELTSAFGRYDNLTTLSLNDITYHSIHRLLPCLSKSCINLQELKTTVVPADYESWENSAGWLQKTRVVQDMPQLHSLDLEFVMAWEIYDGRATPPGPARTTQINADLHRPFIQVIAASKNLRHIRIKTRHERGDRFAGDLDSYARSIAQLHKTHANLKTCRFVRLQLYSTPALASESLKLINCSRYTWLSYSDRAAFTPTDEEVWDSKLRFLVQKGGKFEIPLPKNLEELEVRKDETCAVLLKQLRERSCESAPPLSALRLLHLCGTRGNRRRGSKVREDLTFAHLEPLVTSFPNLENLRLENQNEIDVIDMEQDWGTDEEAGEEDRDLNPEVEGTKNDSEEERWRIGQVEHWVCSRERPPQPISSPPSDLDHVRKLEKEQLTGARTGKERDSNPVGDREAYLRAHLPYLEHLIIA